MFCNGYNYVTPIKYKIEKDNTYSMDVPTGLIPEVIQILKIAKPKPHISIHNNINKPTASPIETNITLRDYQNDVAKAYKRRFRGCWQAPTGSGKTILLLSAWAYWGKPGLIIVPTQEIQEQFYDTAIDMLDEEVRLKYTIGLVGGAAKRILGETWKPGSHLTIASYQILSEPTRSAQADELLSSVDFIAADEGHHLPATTVYEIMQKSSACIRYAQSATLTHNELGTLYIRAATGPLIAIVYDNELIKKGWKATPKVIITPLKCTNFSEYKATLNRNIYENMALTIEILDIVKRHAENDEFVLIVTDRKEHMRSIFLYLRNHGIDVGMVSGNTKSKDRKKIVEAIRDGDLNAVVATQVFDEGLDIPDANAIILAQGGKSPIKHKQRIGRVLRPKEGDNVAYVYDFVFKDKGHLERHSKIRVSRYKKWLWDTEDRNPVSNPIDGQLEAIYAFTDEEKRWIKTGKGNIDADNSTR